MVGVVVVAAVAISARAGGGGGWRAVVVCLINDANAGERGKKGANGLVWWSRAWSQSCPFLDRCGGGVFELDTVHREEVVGTVRPAHNDQVRHGHFDRYSQSIVM